MNTIERLRERKWVLALCWLYLGSLLYFNVTEVWTLENISTLLEGPSQTLSLFIEGCNTFFSKMGRLFGGLFEDLGEWYGTL